MPNLGDAKMAIDRPNVAVAPCEILRIPCRRRRRAHPQMSSSGRAKLLTVVHNMHRM